MKKMIWGIACLTCCAFLLSSASAFALSWAPRTVQLTPDPNGANFQIDERLTGPADIDLPLPEGYANQALRYDVYNYSDLDITAFAVAINMDVSIFDGDFDVTLVGPDNWNVEIYGGLGGDVDISGSGLDGEYLDEEILEAGYTDVFVAWTNDDNAAIHGYTGMIDTFIFDVMYQDLYGDALDLASPVVVVAGGNRYAGGTRNDPRYGGNVPLGGSPAPVPEPATMLLFGTGLAGLVGMRRRKAEK